MSNLKIINATFLVAILLSAVSAVTCFFCEQLSISFTLACGISISLLFSSFILVMAGFALRSIDKKGPKQLKDSARHIQETTSSWKERYPEDPTSDIELARIERSVREAFAQEKKQLSAKSDYLIK